MSNIMIVLDGLWDVTYPELGGKTPYDWGKGENFKKIESSCIKGTLITTPAGFEPDTQACILTMLGVDASDIPAGRSYIEALAAGVAVEADDIVMRLNFVTVTPDGTLEDPTCSAPLDIAKTLREAVAGIAGHSVTPVGSYKSLQVIKGAGKFAQNLKTYPPHNYAGKPFKSLLPSGNELARSLSETSLALLKKHAPYTVLNWAQAVPCKLPSFASLHGGMTGAVVSATHAVMGGAIAMGMQCPSLPTATGDTDTDLSAKVKATLELAKACDFVMLHVGGTDEATHRKNPREKAEFIKKLDTELIAPVLNGCDLKTRVMLTCDHVALCSTGGHTAQPVEFMLYEKGGALSGVQGERSGKESVEIMQYFK